MSFDSASTPLPVAQLYLEEGGEVCVCVTVNTEPIFPITFALFVIGFQFPNQLPLLIL